MWFCVGNIINVSFSAYFFHLHKRSLGKALNLVYYGSSKFCQDVYPKNGTVVIQIAELEHVSNTNATLDYRKLGILCVQKAVSHIAVSVDSYVVT